MNSGLVLTALLTCAACAPLWAASRSAGDYTDRVIVKPRASSESGKPQAMSAERVRRLNARAGMPLVHLRAMSGGAQVLRLPASMPIESVAELAERLSADPEIEYAEPDYKRFALIEPNDQGYKAPGIATKTGLTAFQWQYFEAAGGVNLPAAWDVTTGVAAVTIAVLDTGLLAHDDIDLSRIATGYDFVSADPDGSFKTANDGNARDSDPIDPGDWITAGEAGQFPFQGCPTKQDSTWHGTFIAGIIGAASDNARGVAGVNWVSKILPVRVLGKCGGYVSDIADATRWAAGVHGIPGVPFDNPTPAQIINTSLGLPGGCSITEQSAINDAIAAGVRAYVAAAGNEAGAVSAPANCAGVVSVAATNRAGAIASYSNRGALVSLAAPGGDVFSAADSIVSLSNAGKLGPTQSAYELVIGTSAAAPHVSGIASLMLSANPGLGATHLRDLLRATARAVSCAPLECGAGIVDAGSAVSQAAVGLIVGAGQLMFVSNTVGQSSAPQSVVVTNRTNHLVNVTGVSLSGSGVADFTRPGGNETCTAAGLAPTATCEISIAFVPTSAGRKFATLAIDSNDTIPHLEVRLYGDNAVPAPPSGGGGGGGGGGGCTLGAARDPTLAVLALVSAAWRAVRRRTPRRRA